MQSGYVNVFEANGFDNVALAFEKGYNVLPA